MKQFHDFDALHPFNVTETLQIFNRKIRLSHVPLKNSVSIRGFLEESILGNVKSNSFWCDYRDSDGYRSANGEIIFDSTHENQFVEVSYLGIGTVLRAEDMRDVSSSLDHLSELTSNISESVQNNSIYIGVVRDNVETSFDVHNDDRFSHSDIRDSIKNSRDEYDSRIRGVSVALDGTRSLIHSLDSSIRERIESSRLDADSILSSAKNYTDSIRNNLEVGFNVYRDEIHGLYNAIDNGDEYVESKINALGSRLDSQISVERVSAMNQVKNLREELLTRLQSEIENHSSLIADQIRRETWELLDQEDQDYFSLVDRLTNSDERLNRSETKIIILQNLIDEESLNRSAALDSLNSRIDSVLADQVDYENNLTSEFADLARTVYQARNAVNNQLDSMKSDINLANQNLTYSRNVFERESEKIGSARQEIRDEFDQMLLEQGSIFEQMSDEIVNSFDDMQHAFIDQYESILAGVDHAESVYSYYADQFASIESRIESSIQSAIDQIPEVDLSPVESSIDHIASSFDQSLSDIDEVFTSSIYALQASISNLGSRLTSLETKPVVLSSLSSTVPGALWYSA